MSKQLRNHTRFKTSSVVTQLQRQLSPRLHDESQRIICRRPCMNLTELQPSPGFCQRRIHRVVLKYENGFKEWQPYRNLAPFLNFEEWCVSVFIQPKLCCLQFF